MRGKGTQVGSSSPLAQDLRLFFDTAQVRRPGSPSPRSAALAQPGMTGVACARTACAPRCSWRRIFRRWRGKPTPVIPDAPEELSSPAHGRDPGPTRTQVRFGSGFRIAPSCVLREFCGRVRDDTKGLLSSPVLFRRWVDHAADLGDLLGRHLDRLDELLEAEATWLPQFAGRGSPRKGA